MLGSLGMSSAPSVKGLAIGSSCACMCLCVYKCMCTCVCLSWMCIHVSTCMHMAHPLGSAGEATRMHRVMLSSPL